MAPYSYINQKYTFCIFSVKLILVGPFGHKTQLLPVPSAYQLGIPDILVAFGLEQSQVSLLDPLSKYKQSPCSLPYVRSFGQKLSSHRRKLCTKHSNSGRLHHCNCLQDRLYNQLLRSCCADLHTFLVGRVFSEHQSSSNIQVDSLRTNVFRSRSTTLTFCTFLEGSCRASLLRRILHIFLLGSLCKNRLWCYRPLPFQTYQVDSQNTHPEM